MRDPLSILKEIWGYDSFRGIQEAVITSVLSGKDTLCLMPTGGGKSICYQVPALAMDGLCIVVSPLIALMRDQVKNLTNKGIKATAIYSGMTHQSILTALDNCILGNYKFLYVSPERLTSSIFQAKIRLVPHVSLIAVDEAHCISQWGYDFRPSYMHISDLRNIIKEYAPILALTATATPDVIEDIQRQLHFKEKNVLSMSFERKNLVYVVRKTEDKAREVLHILKKIPEGSAIVYASNRQHTRIIAEYLNGMGLTAHSYNAGLSYEIRKKNQQEWINNKVRIMVATNAFGMGIDKPDVRVVIHLTAPTSIEAYFQEAGRAGRDGKLSYAILLYQQDDVRIQRKKLDVSFPEPQFIRNVYEDMCSFLQIGIGESLERTYMFDIGMFCRNFKYFSLSVDSALKILTNSGYIEYHEMDEIKSRVIFTVDREGLYNLRNETPATERVITAMLRLYPGIFADYQYIDERDLALVTDTAMGTLYLLLKNLSQRRIIKYIPHRNVPTITFTMARVDTERLYLPDSVYKDRKEQQKIRTEHIIQYFTDETQCRSTLLLNYFGEKDSKPCGHCDICCKNA